MEHTSISPVQTGFASRVPRSLTISLHWSRDFFLQGSLWVTNYPLKWKCGYSVIKLSAQIRHKSQSFMFWPFNLCSDWLPGQQALLTGFIFLGRVEKEIWQHEAAWLFSLPFKLYKLETGLLCEYHTHDCDKQTVQTFLQGWVKVYIYFHLQLLV